MNAFEVNFDGLVGPTHNYSGLSYGNVASMQHQMEVSNPREAALQGLEKMKLLSSLGIKQALLPPHERPYFPLLRSLGFEGSESTILETVQKQCPELLYLCSSASAMWTANAGTTTPSIDCLDNHTHFTAANLLSKLHRSLEMDFTSTVFKTLFHNRVFFQHHDPLPAFPDFADEGAANQMRVCADYSKPGINIFVYGRSAWQSHVLSPHVFPARQTLEASQALARRHKIFPDRVLFVQQNPDAIDAGVFHNDVASVGNRNVLLYHEEAFVATSNCIHELRMKMEKICGSPLISIPISSSRIPLKAAVDSYLFNSQLVSLDSEAMALIAPSECFQTPSVHKVIEDMISDNSNPIREVHYFNLRQSMHNGGGPACLRFRVVLTEEEIKEIHKDIIFTDKLYQKLKQWITTYYRDRLSLNDLADPGLWIENKKALDELTRILNLGPLYSFQK